VQWFMFSA